MPSTERGTDWEWKDFFLDEELLAPGTSWHSGGREWVSPFANMTSSIQAIEQERGGWVCVASQENYVIGIHSGERRLLIMRRIVKKEE